MSQIYTKWNWSGDEILLWRHCDISFAVVPQLPLIYPQLDFVHILLMYCINIFDEIEFDSLDSHSLLTKILSVKHCFSKNPIYWFKTVGLTFYYRTIDWVECDWSQSGLFLMILMITYVIYAVWQVYIVCANGYGGMISPDFPSNYSGVLKFLPENWIISDIWAMASSLGGVG